MSPAAQIQIWSASNFCVWEDPNLTSPYPRLFYGMSRLQASVDRCLADSSLSSSCALLPSFSSAVDVKQKRMIGGMLVVGGHESGRTSTALLVAHHVIASEADELSVESAPPAVVYIDFHNPSSQPFREGKPAARLHSLLQHILHRLGGREEKKEKKEHERDVPELWEMQCAEAQMERIKQQLDRLGGANSGSKTTRRKKAVVVMDDFHRFIEDLPQARDRAESLLLLHRAMAALAEHGLFFVVTSTVHLALYFYHFAAAGGSPPQVMRTVEQHGADGSREIAGATGGKRKAAALRGGSRGGDGDEIETHQQRRKRQAKVKHPGEGRRRRRTEEASRDGSNVANRVRSCLKMFQVLSIPAEAAPESDVKDTELLLRHYLPSLHKHHLKEILFHLEAVGLPLHPSLLASITVAWCIQQQKQAERDDDEVKEKGEMQTIFTTTPQRTKRLAHEQLERILLAFYQDLVWITSQEDGDAGEQFLGLLHQCASTHGREDRPKGALWGSLLTKSASRGNWHLKDVFLNTILHFFVDIRNGDDGDTSSRRPAGARWVINAWNGPWPQIALLTHSAHLCRTTLGLSAPS